MEKDNRRIVLGLIMIIAGVVFLLDNLDILEIRIPDFLWRWESILLLVGVVNLFSRNWSAAFVLIGLGVFFWVIRDQRINFFELWPVILIIIGISFILKQGILSGGKKKMTERNKNI
ncbi:MAG: hypothetical protein WBA74_17635 [Cyclobacteriaceae bacterium]